MRGRICLFGERLLQVSTVERGGLLTNSRRDRPGDVFQNPQHLWKFRVIVYSTTRTAKTSRSQQWRRLT
jgi:hypothetical protein